MIRLCLALACLSILPVATRAQGRPAPARGFESKPPISTEKPPDHSREPFVIEQYFTTARFESDGTGERVIAVKARVQSDAGAQQLSQIVFPYNSASEQIDVRYVRVRKPDGKVTTVGEDAIKELIAPIARDAPAYSNCKEKHISVPALVAGDTLEYEISTRIVAPAAPGQFWFEHRFLKDSIVLDERLAVSVPASRKITLKASTSSPYQTDTANGFVTYRWKRSNLAHLPSDSSSKAPEEQVEESSGCPALHFRFLAGRSPLVCESLLRPRRIFTGNPCENPGAHPIAREPNGKNTSDLRFRIKNNSLCGHSFRHRALPAAWSSRNPCEWLRRFQ